MYVTINDVEQDGVRRPFEIFVNSKNLEHYAWVVALTRMISAVFRRGGEVAFVAEELKQVFDPRGGQWTQRPLRAVPGGRDRRHHRAAHDRDRASSLPKLPEDSPRGRGGARAGRATPATADARPALPPLQPAGPGATRPAA